MSDHDRHMRVVNIALMAWFQNLTANNDAMRVRHIGHAALALAMTSSAHALHVHCVETQSIDQAACQNGAQIPIALQKRHHTSASRLEHLQQGG